MAKQVNPRGKVSHNSRARRNKTGDYKERAKS
jgi:hypothetical protein